MIDLIYKMLERNIIKSYVSGDFRNDQNQLNLSLHYLQEFYDPANFRDIKDIPHQKKKLLFQIQATVDAEIGMNVYNRGE